MKILFSAFFYLLIVPIAYAIRIAKIDLLDQKIQQDQKSYWKENF